MCSLDRTYIHAWEDYALTMIVISQSTVFLLALQVLKHVKAVQNLDGCVLVVQQLNDTIGSHVASFMQVRDLRLMPKQASQALRYGSHRASGTRLERVIQYVSAER